MKIRNPSAWLLAQVKPNCASIAERNLIRQGFATFLPLERRTQRRKGQLKSIETPFFPGYIFVGIDAQSSPWRAISSTYGIAKLVRFGLQPSQVPSDIVNELMRCCDPDGIIRNYDRAEEGDEVQVIHGPLTGFIGRVEKLAPDERAWLLIDIMGKETRSLLKRDDLKRVTR